MANQSFVFFWGPHKQDGYLSNWYPAKFHEPHTLNGVPLEFNSVEQYMMWRKASLFNDAAVAKKVLEAKTPKECKNLGRKVEGFVLDVWYNNRMDIVRRACFLKFSQNPELQQQLLGTGDAILAEASPFDRIWGIGLSKHQAKHMPPQNWIGQNLLGQILMEVRQELQQKQQQQQVVDERLLQRSEEGEALNAAKRFRSVST